MVVTTQFIKAGRERVGTMLSGRDNNEHTLLGGEGLPAPGKRATWFQITEDVCLGCTSHGQSPDPAAQTILADKGCSLAALSGSVQPHPSEGLSRSPCRRGLPRAGAALFLPEHPSFPVIPDSSLQSCLSRAHRPHLFVPPTLGFSSCRNFFSDFFFNTVVFLI